MHHYVLMATATAAVPVTIFAWMMGVSALALLTNGESPRAVLAMPRTFFRRCPAVIGVAREEVAGD
jgi:hypothetical protein